MEKTANGWTVIDRDAGVLSYTYVFDEKSGGNATTFAARGADGKMVVISPAYRMSDGGFADLAEFGDVGAVVMNNGFHHLGQPEWKERFPDARFFAAPEAVARVRKKNPKAPEYEPMSAISELVGPDLGVRQSPGTKVGETWMWAKTGDGHAWYVSDLMCNWESFPGNFLFGALWKLTKSGPGWKLFNIAMFAILKDKKKALAAFHEDLKAHPPTVIVPAHGDLLAHDGLADEAKQMVAAAL